MEQGIAVGHLAWRMWLRIVVVAALASALVGGVVAFAGRTRASEPVTSEPSLGAPPSDFSCRELIAIPKRGWVCQDGWPLRP